VALNARKVYADTNCDVTRRERPGDARFRSAQQQQDDADPPGRAARLSFLSGTVSFQPGSVEDWVPATLNRPLTTGDRLWTEAGSRAELNIGSAAIRLNGRTNFSFINLDEPNGADPDLARHSEPARAPPRPRRSDRGSTLRKSPSPSSVPASNRIDVNEQGDATIVTVRGGEGEATAGSQTFMVHNREQVRITGSADGGPQPGYDSRAVPPSDVFDNWCQDRDRREDRSQSARYVSREMPGYADLDDNGSWSDTQEYGPVWRPARVAVDWAPYRYGHWAWISPWGWTWVDDSTWGYAPFHYGRWVWVGSGWAWIPGPVVGRPVYAPAMVAWVGGPSFGVALAIGGGRPAVGWIPLGPGEVWVPARRASVTYVNRVNITNTRVTNVTVTNVYNTTYVNRTTINNVTNVTYVNRDRGVTAVPHDVMLGGRNVSRESVRVSPDALARAEYHHAAPVVPDRAAVLGGRPVTTVAPPPAVANRTVFVRTPPPAQPAAAVDRPFDRNIQRSAPERPMYRQVTPTPAATPAPQVREANPNRGFPQQRPTDQQRVIQPENRPLPQQRPAPQVDQQPRAIQPENRPVPQQRPTPQVDQQPRAIQPENRPLPQQRPAPQTEQPRAIQPENRPLPQQRPNPQVDQQPRAIQPENRPLPQQRPAPQTEQPRVIQPERRVPPQESPRIITPAPAPAQPRVEPRPAEQHQDKQQRREEKRDDKQKQRDDREKKQ